MHRYSQGQPHRERGSAKHPARNWKVRLSLVSQPQNHADSERGFLCISAVKE